MLARNAHGCTITIITAFIMFSGIFCDRVAALSIMFRPAWADEVENATLSRYDTILGILVAKIEVYVDFLEF